jgi:dTDP-4-dehydrorhamnose 3,5-epimerase
MTISNLELIEGGIASDERGSVRFVNSLPLGEFTRFYSIENKEVDIVRGWHGHRFEAKAIIALTGRIAVGAVQVDDWDEPGRNLKVHRFDLDSNSPSVLLVPGGFANAIMALTDGAIAGVFSSSTLEQSLNDDIRFPNTYWRL